MRAKMEMSIAIVVVPGRRQIIQNIIHLHQHNPPLLNLHPNILQRNHLLQNLQPNLRRRNHLLQKAVVRAPIPSPVVHLLPVKCPAQPATVQEEVQVRVPGVAEVALPEAAVADGEVEVVVDLEEEVVADLGVEEEEDNNFNKKKNPMYTDQKLTEGDLIPKEMILKQVEKILAYPLFAVSETLRKFLNYIIQETMSGKVDQIKEYTIAVYGLNKPSHFRPIQDSIVRVHASRLRDALRSYYTESGVGDICEISIPKGSYVPVFKSLKSRQVERDIQETDKHQTAYPEITRIAIMPFKSHDMSDARQAFTDNIGQMLSAELVHLENIAVLSYYSSLQFKSETRSVKTVGSEFGVQYILYGNVHFDATRIRIIIQLADTNTEMLVWSNTYTHDFISTNLFEIEELIVKQILLVFKEYIDRVNFKLSRQLPVSESHEIVKKEIISMNANLKSRKIASL
jgi:TolB-like protein